MSSPVQNQITVAPGILLSRSGRSRVLPGGEARRSIEYYLALFDVFFVVGFVLRLFFDVGSRFCLGGMTADVVIFFFSFDDVSPAGPLARPDNSGSFCFSLWTGSNRSPIFSARPSTSFASKTSLPASF